MYPIIICGYCHKVIPFEYVKDIIEYGLPGYCDYYCYAMDCCV